jgi:hypothetical protein
MNEPYQKVKGLGITLLVVIVTGILFWLKKEKINQKAYKVCQSQLT